VNILSKYNSLKHYKWGDGCDGWNLVDEEVLSVKQEKMPPGFAEKLHYHNKAQQFFYIVKGIADIEIEGRTFRINTGEGIHIKAGNQHRILNPGNEDVEFILCSTPSTVNDRTNAE
jgi:mannose-6-phosphate isomerase-like protein (cupin superfamily)